MLLGRWLVVLAVTATVGSVALAAYLRPYRGKPGATWLLVALGFQALWSLAYVGGWLVDAMAARWAIEVVIWTAMAGEIAFFVAFTLEYTGRGTHLPQRWRRAWFLLPAVTLVMTATNPIHQLGWTGFEIVDVAGLSTAQYTLQPWALAGATVGVLLAVLGSLLLFDTVVSYGPLYRGEAIAVGLSTLPPAAALLAWLYGLGPSVNLVTLAFLPHIALDAYAFLGSDMFEFNPATRRIGERAAIADLGSPVVIVDEAGRVVTLNDAAEAAFGVTKADIRTEPLAPNLGGVDPVESSEHVRVEGREDARTYATNVTPLGDGRGGTVGHTIVFQDVTEELRREQRLSVLNRVLRHNLRNDMSVIRGYAENARREADADAAADLLDTVVETADDLVALGEKARRIDHVLESEHRSERIDLADLLTSVTPAEPATPVTVEATSVEVVCDRETLEVVLESLLENAIEHADTAVTCEVIATEDAVTITIADDGPGLPAHELEALETTEETALEHGSGLGLWLAAWGTRQLGGSLEFEVEGGTQAILTLPTDGD